MTVNPGGVVGGALKPETIPVPEGRNAAAWRTAKTFEAQFLAVMLEEGRQARGELGRSAFGDRLSSDLWRGMRTKAHAGAIARSGGLGIAKQVYSAIAPGDGRGGDGTAINR
jgi:Rod binding domain-containing protein